MKTLILVLQFSLIISSQAQNTKMIDMTKEKIQIDIWSDIVCPFCYVGKKKIEKAINELNAQDNVKITWHSFQLDPSFPKGSSSPTMAYLAKHKGIPLEQVKMMSSQLASQGKNYGIDFQFENSKSFNTWDAHRLIQWAESMGKSNELKEAFMLNYFTKGTDLSQTENLLLVVQEIGLSKNEAKRILDSDEFSSDVSLDIKQAQQIGIRGVPFFILNKKSSISGAQEDQVFKDALISALQNSGMKMVEGANGVCLPNGECK